MLVLALPYRRLLVSRALLVPLGAVTLLLGVIVARRADFFDVVVRSRIDASDRSSSAHFDVYGFVPDILSVHPLFGLGLNNFSVYYEFVTGRTNFGPHSFYVATLVETGLVGTALFVAFLVYLFRRLGRLRAIGRALASPRIRPLAWGMTAALVGTIAANAFYLTMSFYYFFAFAMLALAAPIVFARRL
jgi:O-antigen ligase